MARREFRWGRVMIAAAIFTVVVASLVVAANFADVMLPKPVFWALVVAVWFGFAATLVRMSADSFGVVSYWSARGVMLMCMACLVGAMALFMAVLLSTIAIARLGGKL